MAEKSATVNAYPPYSLDGFMVTALDCTKDYGLVRLGAGFAPLDQSPPERIRRDACGPTKNVCRKSE